MSHNPTKKDNFIPPDFVLLFVCYIGIVVLYKNAKKIFAQFVSGLAKNARLTKLSSQPLQV